MTYILSITSAAEKIFKKLPMDIQKHILNFSKILKRDPFKGQQLKGNYRRFRSLHLTYKGTPYRVVYQVMKHEKEIVIYLATTRENFYHKLDEMRIKN